MMTSKDACQTLIVLVILVMTSYPHVRGNSERNVKEIPVRKFPNIDFLGLGYDAFHGNPHTDIQDPGFKQTVLRITYDESSVSSDGKWFLPDNVHVIRNLPDSEIDSDYSELNGVTRYQDGLSYDAWIEGDSRGNLYKFTLSEEYQKVKRGSENNRHTYVEQVAKCAIYKAIYKSRSRVRVTLEFAEAVDNLPETANEQEYFKFISKFGTHYVYSVVMGAKVVMRSEFEQTAWTEYSQLMGDAGLRLAAGLSFLASIGVVEATKSGKRFDSTRTTYSSAFVGNPPPSDGEFTSWKQATSESPYPIEYKLRPLNELFSVNNLPGRSKQSLKAKSQLFDDAYVSYCKTSEDCVRPSSDWTPVEMDKTEVVVKDVDHVSCPPGQSILHCGMKNTQMSTKEKYRRSYPTLDNRCYCYAANGAKCVAWCSNAPSVYLMTEKSNGTFTVTCSKNTRVAGCHAEPTFNSHSYDYEKWRQHYPNTDGESCTCFDTFGTACVATCVPNLYAYEIRREFGKGDFSVTCSPGNYVLGCGINPIWTESGYYELHRTVHVDTLRSCRCFDPYGSICYALCGRFN